MAIRGGSNWFRRFFNLWGLGTMFNGQRDLWKTFGYNTTPTFDNMLQKYARQDIAKRLIDAPVLGTWREMPKVYDDTGTDGDFAKAWKAMVEDMKILNTFRRADKLAEMGEFSLLYVGFDDGQKADQPLVPGTGPNQRKILYLQAFSQRSAGVKELDLDPKSPRFGKPLTYLINPIPYSKLQQTGGNLGQLIVGGSAQTAQSITVHFTRIIHIVENPLEDDTYGFPGLLNVYNLLDDMLKVVGGSAETYWLTANRGLQIDVDKDLELDAADEQALSDEAQEYADGLSRVMRTKGVTVKPLGSEVANPKGPFDVQIQLLAAARGIPSRILMGSEAGQLASTQDRASWAERLDERQTSYAGPSILSPFIQMIVQAGAIPVMPKGRIIVEWPSNFVLSPLEKAQTTAQQARTLANIQKHYKDAASIGQDGLITMKEARVMILGLPAVPEQSLKDDGTQPSTGNPMPKPLSPQETAKVDAAKGGFGQGAPNGSGNSDGSGDGSAVSN